MFICSALMLIVAMNGYSQCIVRSVISITGNSTIENNGQLAFTAGEEVTGTLINPYNVVTQGFHQPSLLNLIIDNFKVGINAVEVFPNPVLTQLNVLYNIRTSKLLSIDILTSNGILFRSQQYYVSESGVIDVNMGNFPCGLYLVHVYSADKLIERLFKIEKM